MKSARGKLFLVLALLGTLGVVVCLIYLVTRPLTLAARGGTVLVYEIDLDAFPDGKLPAEYKPEDLTAALLRRLDPKESQGITVKPVDPHRVEIGLPRTSGHADHLDKIKSLVATTGSLEFCILANEQDDKAATAAACALLNAGSWSAEQRETMPRELQRRADRGQPPPAPHPEKGDRFEWDNGHTGDRYRGGEATYRWIELGREERATLGLANGQSGDIRWMAAEAARRAGRVLILARDWGSFLIYSRDCTSQKLTPGERKQKEFDYFALARESGAGKRVGGAHLAQVTRGLDRNLMPGIDFAMNAHGEELFYEITDANRPTGDPPFHRHLAILLDDRIVSAPRLLQPIRKYGQITGNFTDAEVDQIVQLLQAGALPVPLKPVPVSEADVEPGWK